MKRFRPYCAGYIVLYALTLLCLGDVIYTLFFQGDNSTPFGDFALLSVLIFALAVCYTWKFIRNRVVIDGTTLRFVWTANVRPKPGENREIFIFRQGDLDMRLIDKRVPLDRLVRYGYVEDLGYERVDQGQAGPKNVLFPVREVAFITADNKRYHMNAGVYSAAQRREIFTRVRDISGVAPEGALAEVLD